LRRKKKRFPQGHERRGNRSKPGLFGGTQIKQGQRGGLGFKNDRGREDTWDKRWKWGGKGFEKNEGGPDTDTTNVEKLEKQWETTKSSNHGPRGGQKKQLHTRRQKNGGRELNGSGPFQAGGRRAQRGQRGNRLYGGDPKKLTTTEGKKKGWGKKCETQNGPNPTVPAVGDEKRTRTVLQQIGLPLQRWWKKGGI